MNRLQAAGKLVPRSRRIVAQNDLAVIGPRGSPAVKKLSDLLGKKIKQVVLAEPACPLGRYSQAFLKTAGIYDSLLPKVVHVDNSRAVLSAVASGTADAALAFSSDADRAGQCQTYFRIPHEQVTAKYVAGIVRCGKKSDDARLLLDFITSTAAANCFRRCGLRPCREAAICWQCGTLNSKLILNTRSPDDWWPIGLAATRDVETNDFDPKLHSVPRLDES